MRYTYVGQGADIKAKEKQQAMLNGIVPHQDSDSHKPDDRFVLTNSNGKRKLELEEPIPSWDRWLDVEDAMDVIGLKGKSTFYNLQYPSENNKQYDETFPKGRRITQRLTVWRFSALMTWVESKPIRVPGACIPEEDE
ncbi:AlpA family transcriptional regulator [Alcanivorax sp. 1008]|uniref:helix-turn-helix transcriptional regulator n=1 Tax=Alcanivorax sp. 1008 TaxID=2816853 RepID=UPI001D7A1DFE|nr:hypothetical protein [Alcanivorax sp. 1008]MCC1497942.1 AlpA family phage regulatory protein [Alcanivorax sp. 1008]